VHLQAFLAETTIWTGTLLFQYFMRTLQQVLPMTDLLTNLRENFSVDTSART